MEFKHRTNEANGWNPFLSHSGKVGVFARQHVSSWNRMPVSGTVGVGSNSEPLRHIADIMLSFMAKCLARCADILGQ